MFAAIAKFLRGRPEPVAAPLPAAVESVTPAKKAPPAKKPRKAAASSKKKK